MNEIHELTETTLLTRVEELLSRLDSTKAHFDIWQSNVGDNVKETRRQWLLRKGIARHHGDTALTDASDPEIAHSPEVKALKTKIAELSGELAYAKGELARIESAGSPRDKFYSALLEVEGQLPVLLANLKSARVNAELRSKYSKDIPLGRMPKAAIELAHIIPSVVNIDTVRPSGTFRHLQLESERDSKYAAAYDNARNLLLQIGQLIEKDFGKAGA